MKLFFPVSRTIGDIPGEGVGLTSDLLVGVSRISAVESSAPPCGGYTYKVSIHLSAGSTILKHDTYTSNTMDHSGLSSGEKERERGGESVT